MSDLAVSYHLGMLIFSHLGDICRRLRHFSEKKRGTRRVNEGFQEKGNTNACNAMSRPRASKQTLSSKQRGAEEREASRM